jgi:hypothetical protein
MPKSFQLIPRKYDITISLKHLRSVLTVKSGREEGEIQIK